MSERLIVIGGGGAGTAAATIAKRLNPDLHVTLFTEFPDIAYSPCGIPFVHGREIQDFESLFLSTVERYIEDGSTCGWRPRSPTSTSTAGPSPPRTRTRASTGSSSGPASRGEARRPGSNLDGLHYVKDIRAAMLFDEELEGMKRVVVYGATPLGVEMAGNLGHRGLQVDFVDEGPWVLSEVLDPDVAEPVHESLEKRGVTMRLGTKVEGFVDGGGRVGAVATSAGELECDAVIVCLHKLPNSALAEAAGIKTGTTGGIVVDERMRTSKDAVWAAGDVVEVPHGLSMIPIRGLTGSHAYARAAPRRSTPPARITSTTRCGSRGAWWPATTRSAASRSARRWRPRWACRTSSPRASASRAPATTPAPPVRTSSCSPSRTRTA